MTRYRPWLVVLVLLAGMLGGCGASHQAAPLAGRSEVAVAPLDIGASEKAGAPGVENMSWDNAEAVAPDMPQRMVVRNADVSLVVQDPRAAADAIAKMAEAMGGFVVSSSVSENTDVTGTPLPYGSITIRVPAERFNEAIDRLTQMAERVEEKRVQGQDVTEEYVDLQSRLRNLEATRDQLQRILDQAQTTEDVLSVYRELSRVQGEIEQVKGRMKYLETSAAMSVITVRLTPSAEATNVSIGGWHPQGTAKTALRMLLRTAYGIFDIAIFLLLYILPVLVLLLVVFVLPVWLAARWGWRWWQRRRARRAAAQESKSPASPAEAQGTHE